MKTLIKIDKNGTKVYHDDACTKCGGSGHIMMYGHVENGVCFKCGGTGINPTIRTIKEYTPEYAAKLAQKRFDKECAKTPEKNAEFFERNGFNENGTTFVVLGNTYEIKDQLKEMGAKFNNVLGWHMANDSDKFQTIEVEADEAYEKDVYGAYRWADMKNEIANKIHELNEKLYVEENKKESKSEYIAEVGEKIEVKATFIRMYGFDSQFGTTYIYTFKDENENVIVWKTGKYLYGIEEVKNVEIKGTVKAQNEYKGVKQTVLTRCKIN